MKYHALFVTFEKAAKFEIVVCCKLVALLGLKLKKKHNMVSFWLKDKFDVFFSDKTTLHALFPRILLPVVSFKCRMA